MVDRVVATAPDGVVTSPVRAGIRAAVSTPEVRTEVSRLPIAVVVIAVMRPLVSVVTTGTLLAEPKVPRVIPAKVSSLTPVTLPSAIFTVVTALLAS